MVELWKSLSDDQMALVGCAVALMVTGTMMSLSYYIGRGRISQNRQTASEPLVLDSPVPQLVPTAARVAVVERREAA